MKRKSYLIGVGMGLIVAALCMGASNRASKKNTEPKTNPTNVTMYDELNNKASASPEKSPEVAESVLPTECPEETDAPVVAESVAPTEAPTVSPEPTKEPEATVSPEPTKEPEATVSPKPTKSPEPTKTPEPTVSPEPENPEGTVTIIVDKGDNSYDICRHLKEAGLIENALDYDNYLCKENYDNKIRSGSYVIPVGSDYETIAKILIAR